MQDPSAGVSPQLLPYVHLVSSFRYALHQHLSDEDAVNYLLNAPRIVREMAPVAWQFITVGPNDGTVLLAWQPPGLGHKFASDGYIWADPEQSYHFETRGLTIEVLVHRSGYRPQVDPISCHARRRYHIVRKQPNVQQETDPSLWLIHYGPADPASRIPLNRVPITPDVQKVQNDRMYLMQHGQLVRKEFMLQDRSSWPSINFPGAGPMPGQPYGQAPMSQRPQVLPGYYNQAAQVGQPPKRQKLGGPPHMAAAGPAPMAGAVIDYIDDEDTALGDYLDHLTPREISTARYKQHHEWMEEIFSSVYASSQIVPEDLGLGLAGDLEDLTAGILDNTLSDTRLPPERPLPGDENTREYKKLDAKQMEELEGRISRFVEKSQAELRAMKVEHAKKTADSRRNKTYLLAERKLRNAASTKDVDAVVAEVEATLGLTLESRPEVFCVQKGGLEEGSKVTPKANGAPNGAANGQFDGTNALHGNGADDAMVTENSAANLLDQFGSGSYANTPDARVLTPQLSHVLSQPHSAAPTPGAAAAAVGQQSSEFLHDSNVDATAGDDGLDLIEGMDLDVDLGGSLGDDKAASEDNWVMVGEEQDGAGARQEGSTKDAASAAAAGKADDSVAAATTSDTAQIGRTNDSASGDLAASSKSGADNAELFGSGADDFVSFDNLDTAGDALAEFTGDGASGDGRPGISGDNDVDVGGAGRVDDDDLGLDLGDDSAFGDAFAGTESATVEGGEPGAGEGI